MPDQTPPIDDAECLRLAAERGDAFVGERVEDLRAASSDGTHALLQMGDAQQAAFYLQAAAQRGDAYVPAVPGVIGAISPDLDVRLDPSRTLEEWQRLSDAAPDAFAHMGIVDRACKALANCPPSDDVVQFLQRIMARRTTLGHPVNLHGKTRGKLGLGWQVQEGGLNGCSLMVLPADVYLTQELGAEPPTPERWLQLLEVAQQLPYSPRTAAVVQTTCEALNLRRQQAQPVGTRQLQLAAPGWRVSYDPALRHFHCSTAQQQATPERWPRSINQAERRKWLTDLARYAQMHQQDVPGSGEAEEAIAFMQRSLAKAGVVAPPADWEFLPDQVLAARAFQLVISGPYVRLQRT